MHHVETERVQTFGALCQQSFQGLDECVDSRRGDFQRQRVIYGGVSVNKVEWAGRTWRGSRREAMGQRASS